MAKLYIERGPLRGKELELEEGRVYTLGRDPNCALTFSDSLTSRQHVSVRVSKGRFVLRDLNSRNGTFVNGQQIHKTVPLKLGDQVEVGETLLSLLADDERPTAGGLVGREVAGYQILERVGRGGMGTVYRAKQLSLDRIVAFKVLSPSLAWDKEFIHRFTREARAAAKLVHPNIARALDVGKEGTIYYLAMEYMACGSIEDKIEAEGRIAPDRAVPMLMDVARGLGYAESQGVIHRDIKPENLMLDEQDTVKIVDMGIAGQLDGRRTFAQTEGVFGSPHYIAPEQAAGERIDNRVDIYSLGASAYRMLSGRTVFMGESQTEIMGKHVNEEPQPLRRVAPWVPKRLCDLVMTCLEKEPEDRYQTAGDVLEALERLGGESATGPRPTSLRRVPTGEAKPKRSRYERQRRNKLILVGVIAALAILVLLLLIIPH
ncbi:MAG: protein kinase [Candidatus Brocadiae bacterium]|nr:protein kinase [Candidatus Brocadiia bacterium]